jgi:ABC-2 type transporter.
MFVLLFRFVFGGSIETSQPGGYVQLLMPGIFVQTVAFTLASTAVGLAEDMKKGLIDRFRSLPISRGAVVIGRTFGDALLNILVLTVMAAAGYAVGWRPTSGALNLLSIPIPLYVWLRPLMDWYLCWIGR